MNAPAAASPPLPSALLFGAAEARLASLDALARRLWLGGLTNSQGRLEARLQALALLRSGLHAGNNPVPETWPWPAPPMASALAGAITELGLARYCQNQGELTDTVLASLLFHLDLVVDYRDRGFNEGQALQMAIEAFSADWRRHCGEIDELVEVFGSVPDD